MLIVFQVNRPGGLSGPTRFRFGSGCGHVIGGVTPLFLFFFLLFLFLCLPSFFFPFLSFFLFLVLQGVLQNS